MKAALDVHYRSGGASAACVAFRDWRDDTPVERLRIKVPAAAPYRAGRFYERELPCLLAVLDKADRSFETVLIDGYVHLRPGAGKGLGTHLFESLSCRTRVIGVAKKPLRIADRFVPVLRGRSRRPLYVSAIGCSLERAAHSISIMHGPHRIPTLLRIADHHARG